MIKNLYIVILFLAALFGVVAQEPDTVTADVTVEDEAGDASSRVLSDSFTADATGDDDILVTKITFAELKYTKEKYLLSKIGVKPGDVWNQEARERIEKDLLEQSKIIEVVKDIDARVEGNEVTITVDVDEKLPFLPLFFFTYKNSTGIVPKFLFRYYNLGGYGKYLNFKFQYEPRKNIYVTGRYKDESLFNQKDLTFQTTLELSTSAPNYYTVAEPQYIGVLGQGDSTKVVPWNDELNLEAILDTYIQYIVPEIGIKLKPYIYVKYKKIWASFDGEIHAPRDEIEPKAGMEFSIPTGTMVKIEPYFEGEYKLHMDNSTDAGDTVKRGNTDARGYTEQTVTAFAGVNFPLNIQAIGSTITPGIKVTTENVISQYIVRQSYFSLTYDDTGNYVNRIYLDFSLGFYKKIALRKTEHEIDLKSRVQLRPIDFTTYPNYESPNSHQAFSPDHFKVYNDFKYKFQLTFYKGFIFGMKYYLFYYHNDVLDHSGYEMNEYPGSLKGWAGLIGNFSLIIPVLEFTTPSWFNKTIDRPLRWKMLWEFYLDGGLAQGYEGNENLSINRWGFHLNPAAGIGTAIKFDPVFIPAYIRVDFGIDVWRIVKTKAFSGSILFSFTIEDN